MKKVFGIFFFSAVIAALAVVAAFELVPDSRATRFIDPWCRPYYSVAREKALEAMAFVRSKTGPCGERREDAKGCPQPPAADREEEKPVTREPVSAKSAKQGFADVKWYSRKKLRLSDLKGKTVISCIWNSAEGESLEFLKNVQRIEDGFKRKSLVVFASHRGGENPAVKKILEKEGITVPCCEGAGHPSEPRSVSAGPVYCMFDKSGKLRYYGKNDKTLTVKLVDILSMQ